MPLPRRHSSFLGQPSSERPAAACARIGSGGAAAPRGVYVGSASPMGGASCLGTRVSRRALGISSVFLQGMRSSATPVLPRAGERAAGHVATAAGLNSCLMEYRDKVRALEQLNQQLEEQIRLCLDRKASSAGAWGPLRRDWEDVYRQVRTHFLPTPSWGDMQTPQMSSLPGHTGFTRLHSLSRVEFHCKDPPKLISVHCRLFLLLSTCCQMRFLVWFICLF